MATECLLVLLLLLLLLLLQPMDIRGGTPHGYKPWPPPALGVPGRFCFCFLVLDHLAARAQIARVSVYSTGPTSADSLQAILLAKQFVEEFLLPRGEKVRRQLCDTHEGHCDSRETFPHAVSVEARLGDLLHNVHHR